MLFYFFCPLYLLQLKLNEMFLVLFYLIVMEKELNFVSNVLSLFQKLIDFTFLHPTIDHLLFDIKLCDEGLLFNHAMR